MKRPVQCAEQQETPYIVPATKLWVEDCQKSINCFCQYKDDSSPNSSSRTRSQSFLAASWQRILCGRNTFRVPATAQNFTKCFRSRKVTLQHHQTLHLPPKMTWFIDPRDARNVQYNARSNQRHPSTSPNVAPATKLWLEDLTQDCQRDSAEVGSI